MDERSDQIVEHIENQRQNLGRNLDELQHRIKQTTDWRTQFDRHPMAAVGLALGGGLLLGAMVGGGSRLSGSRYRSSDSSSRSYTGGSSSYDSASKSYGSGSSSSMMSLSSPGAQFQRSKAMETFDNIKGALLGYAAAQARGWFNQMLPGFDHHYDETASKSHGQHSPGGGQQHFSGSGASSQGGSQYAGGGSGQYGSSGFQRHAESGPTSSGSTPGYGQQSSTHEPTPAL